MDVTSIALALGGIAGSSLKAVTANDQITFSRKSVADILIGGAVGVLYPLFPIIALPPNAGLLQQAVMIAVIAYFTGDVAVNLAQKLGIGTPPQK